MKQRGSFLSVVAMGLTVVLCTLWAFPLLWTILTALKPEDQAASKPLTWFPKPITFHAFETVLTQGNLLRWYGNSILTSTLITVVTLFLSLFAAFAFSRLRFPGRQLLFWITLAGFMLPFETLLIPLFKLMNQLNQLNTFAGIILPQLISPISIFVFKQFFDQVPPEYAEAARIDGAGDFSILWKVYIPLSGNIIWAIAIIIFIGAWNNFLWPFIVINSPDMMTVPLGLTQVQDAYGLYYAQLMAAAALGALPVIIAYLIFQKRVTEGFLSATGVKG
jgi:multiple sugar transport system permease protein